MHKYISVTVRFECDSVYDVDAALNFAMNHFCHESLRKHAHAIYKNFFGCKNENFYWKNFDIFLIFAQNIDCGYTLEPPRRGGSNEYPQSMFWSKNKENRYTPVYPSFTILMWGMRGYTLHGHVFLM